MVDFRMEGVNILRIWAYVGKVSELREMLARHRDFLGKEKSPIGGNRRAEIKEHS